MNSVRYHLQVYAWKGLCLEVEEKIRMAVSELETEVDISAGGISLMRERLKDSLREER